MYHDKLILTLLSLDTIPVICFRFSFSLKMTPENSPHRAPLDILIPKASSGPCILIAQTKSGAKPEKSRKGSLPQCDQWGSWRKVWKVTSASLALFLLGCDLYGRRQTKPRGPSPYFVHRDCAYMRFLLFAPTPAKTSWGESKLLWMYPHAPGFQGHENTVSTRV